MPRPLAKAHLSHAAILSKGARTFAKQQAYDLVLELVEAHPALLRQCGVLSPDAGDDITALLQNVLIAPSELQATLFTDLQRRQRPS